MVLLGVILSKMLPVSYGSVYFEDRKPNSARRFLLCVLVGVISGDRNVSFRAIITICAITASPVLCLVMDDNACIGLYVAFIVCRA